VEYVSYFTRHETFLIASSRLRGVSGGRDWTAAEIAQIDRLVRARTPPSHCLDGFPGRTRRALDSIFVVRRRALGLAATRGRPALPRSEDWSSADEASQRAFEAEAAAGSRRLLERQLGTGQYFAAARAAWLAGKGDYGPGKARA
jgi:hypothetical protein